MAKAKIEFDLDNPEDKIAHLRAVKSLDLTLAIWTIIHNTKKKLEWSLESREMDKYDTLEMVYEKIHEILDEHNINIDELIV